MRQPGIFTELRFDTTDQCGVFRAVPVPDDARSFNVTTIFDSQGHRMSHADLACCAEFFARLAAITAPKEEPK